MTSVTYGGETDDGVIWRMGMRVEPGVGDAFDAELAVRSLAYDKDFAPWEVGNTATVVFAPDNPTRVRFLPPGMESAVRWQVPPECPKCGARSTSPLSAWRPTQPARSATNHCPANPRCNDATAIKVDRSLADRSFCSRTASCRSRPSSAFSLRVKLAALRLLL